MLDGRPAESRPTSVQAAGGAVHGEHMDDEQARRSRDLDEVRLMLFPHLPPDEGWRRIDGALQGAADDERAQRIEALAEDPSLDRDLLRRLLSLL